VEAPRGAPDGGAIAKAVARAATMPAIVPEGDPSGRTLELFEEPVLRHKVAPDYPEAARHLHQEGKVIMHATTDRDGNVIDVETRNAIPHLTPASVGAVCQWKYKPGLVNGKPAPFDFTVVTTFTIN
jgi:TonB family protein